MKKIIGIISLFSTLFFVATPVLADDESSIDAHVSTQVISVLISGTFPIDYGTLGYGELSEEKRDIYVKNNGSVVEDIELMGEPATNADMVSWSLGQGSDFDVYTHTYDVDQDGSYTYFYNYYVDAKRLNQNGNFPFSTRLRMPTGSSGTGTFNTKIWVRATASE